MKGKLLLLIGLLCITVIIGGFHWWTTSLSLINITPTEVSRVEIFDGGTGRLATITNPAYIEHIIENLNAVSINREKISLGYMGYSFKMTLYTDKDVVYKKFIINSRSSIRKDPFFYRVSGELIDYDYIKELIDNSLHLTP